MDWQNVLYWISIVLMYVACGMNLYSFTRCIRTEKKLDEALEHTEIMCGEYERMRDKYIELLDEQWKEINNETDAL